MTADKIGFDPNDPGHVVALARLISEILSESDAGLRFALVVWADNRDTAFGVMSNDPDTNRVLEMLDDAKLRVNSNEALFPGSGHA
jgi:hypothetical protein